MYKNRVKIGDFENPVRNREIGEMGGEQWRNKKIHWWLGHGKIHAVRLYNHKYDIKWKIVCEWK